MAANYEVIMREQNIVTPEQRCCFMLGVSAAEKIAEALKPSHNTGSPKLPPNIIEFMAYMVDHCERETITEEYLCQVGSDYIKWRQLRASA